MRHALVLFTLLVTACADVPDDESADDFPELTLENCPQGRCKTARAKPGLVEITAKRAALDPGIRRLYFESVTSDVGDTPDGAAHFQWFQGVGGRGAIYSVHTPPVGAQVGTFAIHGALLDRWELTGHERGALGYFTDPLIVGTEIRQQFEVQQTHIPSIANAGHLRTIAMLIEYPDGTVRSSTREEYLNSSVPGVPALSPQPCSVGTARRVDNLR